METLDKDGAEAEPPRYAGPDSTGQDPAAGITAGRRRRIAVIAVIVAVLLAVMIVLHVTGVVGAGTNG
jgi:hypothetical protein